MLQDPLVSVAVALVMDGFFFQGKEGWTYVGCTVFTHKLFTVNSNYNLKCKTVEAFESFKQLSSSLFVNFQLANCLSASIFLLF